ncbi:MAG: putative spermidine/putrescine transport system substrate-binding protein [Solirubrobacterales bacterium]|jgi:putative spermidine/putrescine transport system substrate-binding protein|nr:putative spermidine/putrescine transport system substrate-binding protein [Solirubrobacterales bacterium]
MRSSKGGNPARAAWLVLGGLLAFMLAFAAGCGSSDSGSSTSASDAQQTVGKGEGELSLVNWAGYVEDGSDYGPKYDWVTPFENQTGCQVSYKEAGTSDEMVKLMRTGQYDGVSASGNATARLVAGGDVAPVNVDLVPNYKDIFPALKDQSYNTFDGVHYGIPHGRGANLLMWNTDDVTPAPTSWDVILDPAKAAQYKGKISAYDDPIYIADAAVYLKAHNPDLGIENPYELDDAQFNAAVDLLKQQRPNVGEYWSNATKQIQAFTNGDDQVGTTWQYQYFILKADGQPIASSPASQGFVPEEGSTGWSDTWMISSEAAHPNCMYLWMNYVTSPKVQAQIAEFFGEAPANQKACGFTSDPNFCDKYHAGDESFWNRVYFWNTPLADCGDDRGETCKDYNDWVSAWTEIKG